MPTVIVTFIVDHRCTYTRFGTMNHWLGMRRNTTTQIGLVARREDWHWIDRTSLDFHYWGKDEPSQNTECAVITATGHWSHAYCNKAHQFICKKGAYYESEGIYAYYFYYMCISLQLSVLLETGFTINLPHVGCVSSSSEWIIE